jgi:hypothetical protein
MLRFEFSAADDKVIIRFVLIRFSDAGPLAFYS